MTLKSRIMKAGEWDPVKAEDAAIELGAVRMECKKPGMWSADTEWFDDGVEWENARIRPLLEALAEVASAVYEYEREADTVAPDYILRKTRREQMFQAYHALDKKLKEMGI